MMLIKCPECGKVISSEVAACPDCGYPRLDETNAADKDKRQADRIKYKGRIRKKTDFSTSLFFGEEEE